VKLLLDTCTFLWIVAGARDLSPAARAAFSDPGNEIHLSAVSSWEIAVKHAMGRLPLPIEPSRFVPEQRRAHGIEELPLDEASALVLGRLPRVHRDPFDRMLVCQAIVGGLAILTPDPGIRAYAVPTLW
jgi:PIN domain nuclease of toxin-antitoxin system